jgi:hypothetical protein
VLDGSLHGGGTLDHDPTRQVAGIGMFDGAEFENGGSGHRMLLGSLELADDGIADGGSGCT